MYFEIFLKKAAAEISLPAALPVKHRLNLYKQFPLLYYEYYLFFVPTAFDFQPWASRSHPHALPSVLPSEKDIYGLTVSEADGEVCLKVNKDKGKDAAELSKMLCAWKEQADKLSSEEISREEYDNWRYHYPKFDTTQIWAKVPSKELSDTLAEAFKEQLKPDK